MKLNPRPLNGLRTYKTKRARSCAVAQLRRNGRNYFVGFRDANPDEPFGLSFGLAEWLDPKGLYRKDC